MQPFYITSIQQGPNRELVRDVDKVSREVSAQTLEMSRLEQRIDRLSLACQAMWELLRDTTDFDDSSIFQKMEEVDLRDGVADGKMGHTIGECPQCRRKVNTQRRLCLYCGEPMPSADKSAFE